MKILVVDDEKRVLEVVQSMLELKGHEAITAASGEEALEKVENDPPDVMLLDIMMPGMDGATLAQRFRDSPETAAIPIVFLTGLVETGEVQRRGPRIGGQLFLAKPFDTDELLEVIDLAAQSG